jgi:membrane-anchored protein YejM (alkaline phosphatase superfamily)
MRRLLHEKAVDPSPIDFHVRDAEGVLAPAEQLVRDKDIRFAFIHMPVPHPPGVYDRAAQRIRHGGSYLDNLALADRDLQDLLDALRASKLDRHTIVIVCSDHSWRIPLWRGAAWWTKEDEKAAKGGFDPRPVLLVHFPAQQHGVAVSETMNSLVMHDAISQMLRGRISDAEAFSNWLGGL